MARLERMGGLWHQSVKVTAKMIPWHTVAGGLLDWWVSPASRKHLRAYVPLPGLPPCPPCPVLADEDEECSDRKGCRMGKEIKPDISTPSPDLVRIVLLLPQTNTHSPFYLFSSPSPSLTVSYSELSLQLFRNCLLYAAPCTLASMGTRLIRCTYVPYSFFFFSFNILFSFCRSRQFHSSAGSFPPFPPHPGKKDKSIRSWFSRIIMAEARKGKGL